MNIIAFFAHPDDETMLAGGTLALLARQGARVHYLCATRGEGGETGDPPLTGRENLGDVREQELVQAVGALRGRSLTFLGHHDPAVGPGDALFAYSDDLVLVAGQLVNSIHQFEADAVITHGSNGEYGHPAHIFTHQAALVAVQALQAEAGVAPRLYSVAASFPDFPRPRLANADDQADLVIDIRPAREQKTAAALAHKTQHALFVRKASEDAGRLLSVPEVIIEVESLHRIFPPSEQGGEDPLYDMLAPFRLPPL